MNLTEAQELVLKECEREKKIALRNLILVIALVVIVITLLAVFALPLSAKHLAAVIAFHRISSISSPLLFCSHSTTL